MIETSFMKLYEELSQLNEGWHKVEYWGEPTRLWVSDSSSAFKNFMRNISNTGMKGLRLVVAPGFYLAANAADLNHDSMIEIAEEELYLEVPDQTEWTTCGIPKCYDFDDPEFGNFEIEQLKKEAEEHPDDEDLASYLNYDAEANYIGSLVADYGTFELSLYNFKSRTCPEYKSDRLNAKYFEDSEIYRVLKPMLKRIHIYGKD